MSDKSGINSGVNGEDRPICRVAYTLGNSQPVVSTIIGDQPLFYMDHDISEEEEYFDIADLGILESELMTLKDQISGYDTSFVDTDYNSQKRADEFLNDANFMTGTNEAPFTDDISEFIFQTLAKSRLANAFLDFAKEHCVEISLSSQVKDAFYDRKTGLILINPLLERETMVLLVARELRRHWHHRQGALIHPLLFHPDNAILINRAHQADLSIAMVRVAWELQLSGYKDAWDRLEDSTMADLCRTFAREAYIDFRTVNNGFASASVFETWFLSDRCRHQDKQLIQSMLADHQGFVFDLDRSLQSVTPELISALGSMPYGKNYLAEHAFTIMNDPIFTDVRDRSNANFLWFIKFERSFKEAEQELHNVFEPAARGDLPRAMNPSLQDRKHGTQENAQVVTLYEGDEASKKSGKRLKPKKGTKSADIIYLRAWSGDAR